MLNFTWDIRKNKSNQKKHGVSFEEASSCFFDPMHLLISDPDNSNNEDRLILIGNSLKNRLLIVVHLEISEAEFRIISARKATKRERNNYEEI